MKTKILVKLIVIFCLGVFMGCLIPDKDEENFKGTMQAQINGNLINFNEAYGDRRLSWDGSWSGIINIVGITDMKVSGHEIQIGYPYYPMTGISYHPYCLYRPWIGNYYEYKQTAYITNAANSDYSEFTSTLTFTSVVSGRYKGTFSFTAFIVDENLKDSVVVRDGKFEIDSRGKKW